jgi:hypothetical protein
MVRFSIRARVTLLGATIALLSAVPSPLLAQPAPPAPQVAHAPPSSSDLELAQQQFVEGREAVRRGDDARALVLFLKSQELHPTPGTLLNVAACEEKLGMTASAWQHFHVVMTQVPEGDDRLPIAKQGVARVSPRVSFLRIDRGAGAPSNMRIKRGEEPLAAASLGVEQPADPGTYVVTTSAPGHEDRRYEVQLTEGKRVSLVVDAGKEVEAAGPTPLLPQPAAPPRSDVRRSLAFALGGIGVAGLGVGAVTGILAILKKNELEKVCPNPMQCSAVGRDIGGSGRALAGVSTASLILGVAGAGAGAVLFFTSGDKPAAAAVGPAAFAGGGGVVVRGAF